MADMLFVGGSYHAEVKDINVDGQVPDNYGDAVGGGYYSKKDCEFIHNNPLTGRPQHKYTLTVYVHSDISRSQNPEGNTYQLMADAVLRRYFLAHGAQTKVSGMMRPVDDRVIQGNGAGVPAHEDPPPMRDSWDISCVQCGRDEHVSERLDGDALVTDPKHLARVYSGKEAAQVIHSHNAETGHELTMRMTQVPA